MMANFDYAVVVFYLLFIYAVSGQGEENNPLSFTMTIFPSTWEMTEL